MAYKVSKQSKFIANSDSINVALNRAVNAQIKKDSQAHGTYSMNSFAIYPKHLKNTVQTLFQSNAQNLMPNSKKFENAFTDQTQQESNIYKDIKLQMLEESKKKRRFMTSIRLEKSFHLKSTFEIWYLLHSRQKFDTILQRSRKPDEHLGKSSIGFDFYSNMKPCHKSFKKQKDSILSEMNVRYLPPDQIPNFFYSMKQPLVCLRAFDSGQKPKTLQLKAEEDDPQLCLDLQENEEETTTYKEMYQQLNEAKRKAANKYRKWKNSLQNQNNLNLDPDWELLMKNDEEYQACCVKIRHEKYQTSTNFNRPKFGGGLMSRVQSAKNSNQLESKNSKSKMSFINAAEPQYEAGFDTSIKATVFQKQLNSSEKKNPNLSAEKFEERVVTQPLQAEVIHEKTSASVHMEQQSSHQSQAVLPKKAMDILPPPHDIISHRDGKFNWKVIDA